jgi:long-chain acyl-CoA synthetase
MKERESVASYLEDLQSHGEGCAYIQRRGYRSERWSYRRLAETSLRFARELETLKIGKGDRIMLWGENSAEWVAVYFGCALGGVVVVPMDDGASADFAERVGQQVNAKLLVCSRKHLEQILPNRVSARLTVLEDLEQSMTNHSPKALSTAPVGREDILQIVFTSGTTSDPKGVVITHGNVLANIAPLEEQIRSYLKYERLVHPLRFLNLLPLSHVFGQFLGMFLPPILGGVVIFQEELKPSEVISTIRRERVSVLVCVPRVLQSLKQKVERDAEGRGMLVDFRQLLSQSEGHHFLRRWWTFRHIHRQFGWKFWAFICGGAALDGETEEFWGRLGYAVIQGYGLTETTSMISVNHPFRLGKGSIGKVLAGREVKLAEDGEILVRGGGVASRYWSEVGDRNAADATSSDGQGWYRTGDIGALDEAGNLYFKGRKKDVIVTPGGMNVYPEDLETALRRQLEVKDCVVVGIERGGNAEPCAVVILHNDASVEVVVQSANQSLAEYQRMRMWMKWPQEDFPRTSTQKPRRKQIREAAEAQMLHPAVNPVAANGSPLAELIRSVAGRSVLALGGDANLDSDLGLSSLDRVELLNAIEDRYQVDLSETGFSAARTVGDLERMLRGERGERALYHYPRWVLRWPVTWVRFLAHYLLLRPAIILLGWPRIEGREHLRDVHGPLLVIANHIDDVDVGFIQTALPARFRHRLATAAGGEALEALRTPLSSRSFLGKIFDRIEWILGVSLLNLFPLPREAGFRQSFSYAGEAVDRGYSVLVFPEGRHTVDGKMNSFRAGIGLLADNLGIPVLPMRIIGLFEVKQAGKRFARPWKIQVRIGRPIRFDPGSDAERIAEGLQRAVEEL